MDEEEQRKKEENTKMLKVATQQKMTMITEKLKRYLPHSALAYGILLTHLRYEGLSATRRCTLLYADDSTLVILILQNTKGGLQILIPFWDAGEEDERDIIHLFSTMSEFNWSQPFLCNASPLELIHKVETMITRKQIGHGAFIPSQLIEIALLYGLSSPLKEKPSLPEGFEMRMIKESDAKHCHDHWKYNFSISLESYRIMLKEVPGYAIVRCGKDFSESHAESAEIDLKETNGTQGTGKTSSDGKSAVGSIPHGNAASLEGSGSHQNPGKTAPPENLVEKTAQDEDHQVSDTTLPVAWSHLSITNSISNTFTLPSFRRKGLSKVVTVAMAEHLLRETGVAYAFIEEDNVASLKLHEQLGFEKLSTTGWQFYRKRSYK